ncbi:MAG: MotA/TolQ/ExbB proton channel family protein [Candidatus Kapabacteria bacterium]|nr:MotA/TolQ/ExbB proton channel family protein [Candidatus Kapabacteria bacterium]MBX7156171.1 MotA/TolQ/ExbB proton channel family protein [Bacteroidota bacterium]
MKNNFNSIVIVLAVVVAYVIYYLVLGASGNFKNGNHEQPINMLGTIYTGGILVGALIACILLSITFVIERILSISKAKGKGDTSQFVKRCTEHLAKGNIDEVLKECDAQRGSLANIMRAGLERFQQVENDNAFDQEKKIAETQRAIDEATNLETPLLEKNLVILSTVASIATMIGLLGTTLGMIRSFRALGESGGTVSAQQLSIGISEALYNTAGGLLAAIISIVAFNMFTTRVDDFVYMIDDAIMNIMEILTIRVKK